MLQEENAGKGRGVPALFLHIYNKVYIPQVKEGVLRITITKKRSVSPMTCVIYSEI